MWRGGGTLPSVSMEKLGNAGVELPMGCAEAIFKEGTKWWEENMNFQQIEYLPSYKVVAVWQLEDIIEGYKWRLGCCWSYEAAVHRCRELALPSHTCSVRTRPRNQAVKHLWDHDLHSCKAFIVLAVGSQYSSISGAAGAGKGSRASRGLRAPYQICSRSQL